MPDSDDCLLADVQIAIGLLETLNGRHLPRMACASLRLAIAKLREAEAKLTTPQPRLPYKETA